jgi:hypothetical protein
MSATHYVKVFEAADGWRWHEMESSDITAESGEGYKDKQDAIDKALAHAPEGVPVIDAEGVTLRPNDAAA